MMHALMDNTERITGVWWMSDDPDNRVPGELLVQTRKLILNGSFEAMKPGTYGGARPGLYMPNKDKTIQGHSRSGNKRYTLEFFENYAFSITLPGYKVDTFNLGNIFEGDYFNNTVDLSFNTYYVEFPDLFEWVNDGIVSAETTFIKGDPLRIKDTKIVIGAPKSISIYKKDSLQISLSFSRSGVPLSGSLRQLTIEQKCLLKIQSVEGLNFYDTLKTIHHIGKFLSIAIGRHTEPVFLQMNKGDDVKSMSRTTLLNVKKKDVERKDLQSWDMNFNFNDVKGDIQKILKKWLQDRQKHADMFDLFSQIQSDLPKTINNQFLEVVSAIEGYVRIELNKPGMDIAKTIKVLNEYLAKDDRPLKPSEYESIRITRNKLSHLSLENKKDEARVLSDEEKLTSVYKLKFLLEYGLLKNLNVSSQALKSFHDKNKPILV